MQDYKIVEAIFFTQRMELFIQSFEKRYLNELNENIEARNLMYMFLEQLENSLITNVLDSLK